MGMNKKGKNRKGYFFSLDAFIALLIILGIIVFIKPTSVQTSYESDLQGDLLVMLSSLQIGEINNDYVQNTLIPGGYITKPNQSVLEQIGEFYANSDPEAELLAQSILDDLDLNKNIGLYFEGAQIAASGDTSFANAEEILTSRQIISGIQEGNATQGYSSRAFLFSENKVDYFYFGGYVGDGNISVKLNGEIIGAEIEAVFGGNFDLYINDQFVNSYVPTANIPYSIDLSGELDKFISGDNYIDFRSTGYLYIAGGFVKVVYNQSQTPQTTTKYRFPGIDGLINVYDSFYISGELNSMEVFLSYTSNYDIFMTMGNKTIYSGNGTNQQVTITDSNLSAILDYSNMDDKTIPFRLGLENVSYVLNLSKDADVFSVTDLSGSMDDDISCLGGDQDCCEDCFWFWCFDGCQDDASRCEFCGGTPQGKIISAKQANKVFIDAVIDGGDENRVGLIGYSGSFNAGDYHNLSRNNVSLKSEVDSWDTGGSTCICCGINEGVSRLNVQSPPSNFRSLVVMSDGEANIGCDEQGVTLDLNGNGQEDDAGDDAIKAACDAYNNHGIRVYAVAFGDGADNKTLAYIGTCGGGGFYSGGVDDLISIYQDIAQEIINAAYYEQTIIAEGIETELFPESYISIGYNKTTPYGLIITAESEEFDTTAPIGNFSLPFDATPHEVKVVSYSGSRWTSNVEVFNNNTFIWESVFNLSEYGDQYTELGDPYAINIPIDKVRQGENSLGVYLALGPGNLTDGSQYNKVIYSVIKNISSYSAIVASAEGCIWTIQFEDNTNSTMSFPTDYSGTDQCYYTSESVIYNNNDAINNAIYSLLLSLDLNSNQKIETKFSENDLTINSIEISGIPFTWETEVQARIWR